MSQRLLLPLEAEEREPFEGWDFSHLKGGQQMVHSGFVATASSYAPGKRKSREDGGYRVAR